MKLLSFGSANIDLTYPVEHIAREKETISCARVCKGIGGKGLNQAIAMARAAGSSKLAARVSGSDGYILDYLRSENVDASLVELCGEDTGHAVIQLDAEGQNSIIVVPGANHGMTREYIERVFAGFSGGFVLLQNEVNLIPEIIEAARRAGCTTVFNPSPFTKEVFSFPLDKVDIFALNEVEGYEISGRREPCHIISELHSRYPGARILLTLGGEGSMFFDGEKTFVQPIVSVPVVDTTAAGDTFVGYFISEYAGGAPPERALLVAATAAAITVSKPGAASSIPLHGETLKLMENA